MNYSNRIIELFETGQIPERVRIGTYNLEEFSCAPYFETEPPETQYLVQDYVPKGVAGTLTGRGGTGKSYLALDLALRVAAAADFSVKWLGNFKINTSGTVVYISAEEPAPVVHNRVYWLTWNLAKELDKPFEEVHRSVTKRLFLMNVWGQVRPLFEKEDKGVVPTDEYWKLCYTFEKYKPVLTVWDTRSRLSSTDENDNVAAAREVTYYESIAYTTGATVLILHHVNKASYNNQGNLYGSARGAGSFQDNLRFGLTLQHVESDSDEQIIRVINTKQNYSKLQTDIFLRRNQYQGFELASDPKSLSKKVQADEDLEILKTFIFTNPGLSKKDTATALQGTKGKPGLLPYHRARAALSLGLNLGILEKVEENGREIIKISTDPIPPNVPISLDDEELEDLPPNANASETSEPSDGKNGRELINTDAAPTTSPIGSEELLDGPPNTKSTANASAADTYDGDHFLDA